MAASYGSKFLDLWRGVEISEVKAQWAEKLGEYTNAELRRGLTAIDVHTWPPVLPEFLLWCRPPIEPSAAHAEACRLYPLWCEGKDVTWSRPEIFWAAQKVGLFDLRSIQYAYLQGRWKDALAEAPRAPAPEARIPLEAPKPEPANPVHVAAIFERLARIKPKSFNEFDDDIVTGQPRA